MALRSWEMVLHTETQTHTHRDIDTQTQRYTHTNGKCLWPEVIGNGFTQRDTDTNKHTHKQTNGKVPVDLRSLEMVLHTDTHKWPSA